MEIGKNKKLLNDLKKQKIPSLKSLNSLQDLKSCTHICEMLALIKSKNFTPGTPPLKFLQANLPQALMPLLKSLTIGNICEIARFLLDNMPSKIPKLIISPNINNYAAVSYTQRSYLNTHLNKSYIRNSTPTIKKTKEIR